MNPVKFNSIRLNQYFWHGKEQFRKTGGSVAISQTNTVTSFYPNDAVHPSTWKPQVELFRIISAESVVVWDEDYFSGIPCSLKEANGKYLPTTNVSVTKGQWS